MGKGPFKPSKSSKIGLGGKKSVSWKTFREYKKNWGENFPAEKNVGGKKRDASIVKDLKGGNR